MTKVLKPYRYRITLTFPFAIHPKEKQVQCEPEPGNEHEVWQTLEELLTSVDSPEAICFSLIKRPFSIPNLIFRTAECRVVQLLENPVLESCFYKR